MQATTRIALLGLLALCPLASSTVRADNDVRKDADKPHSHEVPDAGVRFLSNTNDGQLIWDLSRVPDRERTNLEFPYLIRFKGEWYCSFREGDRHGNHPSGRARVIRSENGRQWETATLIEWQGGDIRDPRMSVTPDRKLMINSSIYVIGKQKDNPASWEKPGRRQSVTWLSENGTDWDGPFACPTGFDTWRWDVAWHDGVGYSVGYSGKDRTGALYRTADGKTWQTVVRDFFPDGHGTEAALAFDRDGTAYCLLRPAGANQQDYGMFGVGQPPDYVDWRWHEMRIDAARNGEVESGAAFGKRTGSIVGGQKLLRLSDGRLVAATAKGGFDLFWLNPDKALFTRFVRMAAGKSYPGIAEHNGELWITNTQRAARGQNVKSGIYLTRIHIPPPASLPRLLDTAAQRLADDVQGFGRAQRDALAQTQQAVRTEGVDESAPGAAAARRRLLRTLGEYRSARQLKREARRVVKSAESSLADAAAGFGHTYAAALRDRINPLETLLADRAATSAAVQKHVGQLRDALADLRRARRARARAADALSRATANMEQARDGFTGLFQKQLDSRAQQLREALHDADATTRSVRKSMHQLLEAENALRAVNAGPVRARQLTPTSNRLVIESPADWRRGALVRLRAGDHGLVLQDRPVLTFGADGPTPVRIDNPPRIAELADAFTMTAWALPRSTEASYRTLIDKGGRDAGFSIRHGRTVANDNAVSTRMYAEGEPAPHAPYGGAFAPDNPAAFDNRWHHYAATYDGQTLRLYIDGQQVHRSPKTGRADLSQGDFTIGTLASGREPWVGHISRVSVWSRALPAASIAAQQNRALSGDESDLVAYWPLDEGNGNVAQDRGAHGYDGRIHNGDWSRLPARRGWRVSDPIHLASELKLSACTVEWNVEALPQSDKSNVDVQFGITSDADTLPQRWSAIAPGADLTETVQPSTLSGRYLWLRQVLHAENPKHAPRLTRIVVTVR